MSNISGTPENIARTKKRKLLLHSKKQRNDLVIGNTERRAFHWLGLLGEELRDKLIKQAHEDAKKYHEFVKQEHEEYIHRRNANARRQIARGASAAT